MTRGVLLMAVALSVCATALDCSRSTGECRYGEEPMERQVATVQSISHEQIGEDSGYFVTIEEYGQYQFWVGEADHQRCIVDPGLTEGSTVTIEVTDGGPCPPLLALQCQVAPR